MAQLSSPGVSVPVSDESFYTPAAPGTVPLIVVASASNKANSAGTGIAPGTLAANAGQVYLLTSQMDLGSTFGIPYFQTDAENNPVHAGELNEYGLQAAYSFLGVSNRAYVVRADLDLGQLKGSGTAPEGLPADGTYWFDTATTNFGVFQWNAARSTVTGGQTFAHESVTVITDDTLTSGGDNPAPLASFGAVGDYAVVAVTTLNKLWLKKYQTDTAAGTWVEVGSPAWAASWPTAQGNISDTTDILSVGDTIIVNGYTVTGATTLSGFVTALGSNVPGITAKVINGLLNFYSTGASVVLSGTGVSKAGLLSSTYLAPALTMGPHYQIPTYKITDNALTANGRPTGSIWVKTTPINLGATWDVKHFNAATNLWVSNKVSQLYPTNQAALAALDPKGGGANLALGTVYVKFNDDEGTPALANFKLYRRAGSGATSVTSSAIHAATFTNSQAYNFTVSVSQIGTSDLTDPVTVSFIGSGSQTTDAHAFMTAFTAAVTDANIMATLNSDYSITITHAAGGDIRLVDGTHAPLAKLFTVNDAGTGTTNFYTDPTSTGSDGKYIVTLWNSSAFAPASAQAPATTPADQTLWYNTVVDEVDLMIHDGMKWVGYANYTQEALGQINGTDPAGPIVSATQPTQQSGGGKLSQGDIWVSTAAFETYPHIYKYNFATKSWVLIDNTDHTTENGIIFGDARWSLDGTSAMPASIKALLSTDFVDFDSPDPALYPKGMLLWNTRRSGNTVLRYVKNYVDVNAYNTRYGSGLGTLQTDFFPDVWVSAAPHTEHGVAQFGRHAQRALVVKSLNALIESNQQIRDEDSRVFNLISCPGYLETLPALNDLNTGRGLLSFIVADTPARLTPDATSLSNWAQNVSNATGDGETGLVSTNAYSSVFYPWGFTTDLKGNNIVVPPSHMMLRTIALNDNVAYPWFAPAGVRRGGITNASSVGYVNATGEFETVALNTGQRDTLATVHVNPITYLGGVGLVNYGQKTRQLVASSLDRINVARLVIYLRYQLNAIAKPYIFEPNDTITRNELKQQIESMLLELTGQRALYDYLVVCDTTNNTPSRIDANELHVDIAIEPVKAVEFIYIPLRLENTGAIKGLGK